MTGDKRGPLPVGYLATGIIDPVLRKRAGISVALIESWEEIVGPALAQGTRPEKIVWPRRRNEDDPFEPATLVVAAEMASALRLQHDSGNVIAMVNGFLGFGAVGRLKIVQKPVRRDQPVRPRLRQPSESEVAKVQRTVAAIEDEGLKASLERLGRTIAGSRKR